METTPTPYKGATNEKVSPQELRLRHLHGVDHEWLLADLDLLSRIAKDQEVTE